MKISKPLKIVSIVAISTLIILWLAKKARQRQAQKWINALEKAFGKTLSLQQEESVLQLVKAFDKYGDGDQNKLAYILATAKHESRLLPVREGFASSDAKAKEIVRNANRWYSKAPNTDYYGRGLVQITLLDNYKQASDELGIDFVKHPDKVLDTKYAAEIAVKGMLKGWFGKPLGDFVNSSQVDFYNARRSVNALDRADLIKGYTLDILRSLPNSAVA